METQNTGLMYNIEKSVMKKQSLYDNSQSRYFVRAMLACLFLTLGTAVAVMIGQSGEEIAPGLGKMLYAFMFSWSLVMIIYMNAELGTSNMMYMTIAMQRKWLKPKKALAILFYCVLFNLIGGIIASLVISFTYKFHALPSDHYLFTAVAGKLAKTPVQVFSEGIFANIIVNTAVYCTIRMKDDAGKIIAMIFIIFIFAYLGFEHVIANFSSFSLAFFASGGTVPGMTFGAVTVNLIVAFLGNYVGGALMIGMLYSWLNKNQTDYVD